MSGEIYNIKIYHDNIESLINSFKSIFIKKIIKTPFEYWDFVELYDRKSSLFEKKVYLVKKEESIFNRLKKGNNDNIKFFLLWREKTAFLAKHEDIIV